MLATGERAMKKGLCLVAVTVLVYASRASAVPVDCTAGGGPACSAGPPKAEVTFHGQTSHDWQEASPPYVLDVSQTDTNGSGRGVVDLGAGTLKATTTTTGVGFTVIATGNDLFTVGGPPPGTPVSVTATLTAGGTGLIPEPGRSFQTMVQIQKGSGGAPVDFELLTFQAGNNAPLATPFDIALDASITFAAEAGTPFPIVYFLRLDAGNGAGNTLDFGATGHLSFAVDQGTVTSSGGFGTAAAAVPEPATIALLATGLATLGVTRWRKSRVAHKQ
jgi:PEP-CTERM motif-containing protein